MLRGRADEEALKKGWSIAGGGIYFAEHPRECEWKTDHGKVRGRRIRAILA